MKKLFKALAAISLVALFMSCELTLTVDDDTNITVYNGIGYDGVDNLYIITANDYAYYSQQLDGYSFDYMKNEYPDYLNYTLSYGSSIDIDTTDTSLIGYYIILEDTTGEYFSKYITSDTQYIKFLYEYSEGFK